MVLDFILVLSRENDGTPASGYMLGYSRTGFEHHYYPKVGQPGMEAPKVLRSGVESFGRWFAGILTHRSGRGG